MQWLIGLYYRRLRRLDIKVLWPTIRSRAPDLNTAKAAFAVHASRDPAWLVLGECALRDAIDALE